MLSRSHTLTKVAKKDNGDMVVDMAFASDRPYERWWGIEVLDMAEKSVRLGRLNDGDGGSVLFNHNWNDLRGRHVPGSVKTHDDGFLRGQVIVPSATQVTRDTQALIESKTLSKASVGYEIHRVVEQTTAKSGEKVEREISGADFQRILRARGITRDNQRGDGDVAAFLRDLDTLPGAFERKADDVPIYRVVDWEPVENSFVTVPADNDVGVGRALETVREVPPPTQVSQPAAPAASERKTMTVDTNAAAGASAEEQARLAAQAEANVSAVDREKTRIRAIEALGKANSIDSRKVEGWIRSGTTLDKIADEILAVHEERGKARPTSAADLGLTRSEQQRYSVFRLMRLMSARPSEVQKLQEEAAYEIECSRGVAKRLGRDPDGFFVPGDILRRPIDPEAAAVAAQRHNRAMTVVPGASGGYLVETENMGFIEILRNTMVLSAMGARQLSGLVGNITVPRQTGATSVTWQAGETTAATASDQTLGQLSMTPKTAIIVTEVGRTLMLQSNPSAEAMVMADLAQSTALGVDYAGINGTGGAQPIGILNTTGITTGQDAGTATQAKLLAFQSVAATANALLGRPGYVARPAGAAVLAGRPRFTNSDTPMWDGNIMRGTVAGLPAMSSMQMPADGSLLFGSWDSVVVGEWGVLELSLNPYQNFNAGVVGIRAIYSVDVMVRYPQAFVYSTSLS